MPIYAYSCESCHADIELLQKIDEPAPAQCPQCSAEGSLRKQLTAAGFRLKGGGWYETDFKSGNRRNVAGDRESDGKKGSAKDTGKDSSKGSSARAERSKPAAPAAE